MFQKPKHKKRKPEPVQKVQMQDRKRCWITGRTDGLHKHHIYGGARRQISERYGLYIYLRPEWHNMSNKGIHFDPILDKLAKKSGQLIFESVYSREKFMELFGRNYLE